MSKIGEDLGTYLRIHNAHQLLHKFGVRGRDIGISFHGADNSRGGRSAHASVYSPTHKTDPSAHFMDYGCKKFVGSREETLPKAKKWALEKYGIDPDDWVPDPSRSGRGSYVPKEVRQRALAELALARKKEKHG